MSGHLDTGRKGENLAVEYLTRNGLRLKERNYRTRFGEIDLIFEDGDTLVFVEVKTRTSDAFADPFEAVGPQKRRRLTRTALAYMKARTRRDRSARFDVVSIVLNGEAARIEHVPDAFDPDRV